MRLMNFIFRLILFLMALAAIVIILGVGIYFFRDNDKQQTAITIAETGASVGRSPESLEDFVTYVLLQAQADELSVPVSADPSPVPFTVEAGERPLIASVYLNRLRPESPEKYLRADPTVQYAMGYQSETDQWWKTPVTLEEYSLVDSPYNTYLYAGLPPGPIANPGIASIMAVLQPAETNYFYFVCRRPLCEGGEHIFAETYEEHQKNVATYQGQ